MKTRVFLALLLSLIVFAACGGSGGGSEAGGGAERAGGAGEAGRADRLASTEGEVRDAAFGSAASQGAVVEAGSALPPVGPSVIKIADVELEVPRGDFQESLRDVVALARSHGGFVVSTSTEGEGSRSGTVVLRVAADRFEQALADIGQLGTVEREEVSGEDVSQEFVDLEARLRNFEAQEAVLLRLMQRSQTVQDTIRVQRELQGVQLEIERLRGRLRYLRDQTAMGTITLGLVEAGAPAARVGALQRAWRQAVDTFFAVVSGVIIGAGFVVPVGLLLGIALVVFRRLLPRFTS